MPIKFTFIFTNRHAISSLLGFYAAVSDDDAELASMPSRVGCAFHGEGSPLLLRGESK